MSEELLLIYGKKLNVDDMDTQMEVFFFVPNFISNAANLGWFLENLHSFKHQYTREVSLGYITHFIHGSWNMINPNLHDDIIAEFFIKIFEDPNFMQPSFLTKTYDTQADLVHQFYPEILPNIFNEIVKSPKNHLYGFLSAWKYSLYSNSSVFVRNNDAILQKMLEDGSQMLLVETVIKDLESGIDGSSKAFSTLVEWIDSSVLGCLSILGDIMALFQIPEATDSAIMSLTNYMKRPDSLDAIVDFVNSSQIATILGEILTSDCSELKMMHICELINVMVTPIVETDEAEQFLEIAKLLFLQNVKISNLITDFIRLFAKSHPDYVDVIANATLEKLLEIIQSDRPDKDLEMQSPLKLLKSLSLTTSNLQQEFITLSSGISPSENIDGCAALLACLTDIVPNEPEIVAMFNGLLEIESNIESPYVIALGCYAKMAIPFIRKPENIDFTLQLFEKCAQTVIMLEEANATHIDDYLFKVISIVCKLYPQGVFNIENFEQIIFAFVISGRAVLLDAARSVSNQLPPDSRVIVFSACANHFAEIFSDLTKLQNDSITPIFDFIAGMNLSDCDQSVYKLLANFISAVKEIPDQNKLYLSSYAKAAVHVLGTDGFPLFWDMLGMIDWEVFASIADAAVSLSNQDDIKTIGHLIISKLTTVPTGNESPIHSSDNQDMYKQFHISASLFFIKSNCFHLLEEDDQKAIICLFSDVVSRYVADYSVISEIITFENSILTPENYDLMVVSSATVARIISPEPKEADEREMAADLLRKYFAFSRHLALIDRQLFVDGASGACQGSSSCQPKRQEYAEIACIEDENEFNTRVEQFISEAMETFVLGLEEEQEPEIAE
ncbi:hypothetical protein TVAG_136350 [Trichomonas vaginalis G3]|uniref:Importin N-terminal domain-containing protein n=1 Tax=Trichomonas vaginalis (strain ATCC PRA-98 / G3) TaxID=412133 RepID=A2DJB7_TRIV3|nr:hypothetical protein TVAGG3_0543600 [Trichomonas vaginalis G3]EAY19504.1 hypothetical protein TVAG_136350 [Trichomonas vaginalis G3]KAI5520014.1 hypothetical protein TVAGG3_0543600 [Trichomonas vaginalis G3]|eukprot:XP_001580490.1 hypothetical protein [Trichomonas vaginalis G3]